MRTIYLARENMDQTEGRGPMITIAAFEEEKDAKKAVKGRGVMGYGDGAVAPLKVYSNFEDWKHGKMTEAKRTALEKLTEEEREALGV